MLLSFQDYLNLITPSLLLLLQGRGGAWKHHKEERMEVLRHTLIEFGVFLISVPARLPNLVSSRSLHLLKGSMCVCLCVL